MVRALLEGRKTQTRRSLKPQPVCDAIEPHRDHRNEFVPWRDGEPLDSLVPPFAIGDLLWARERWSGIHEFRGTKPSERRSFVGDGVPYLRDDIWYWADGNPSGGDYEPPRPGRHMPRWASRLTLRVTDVRVQRLQEISEEDAKAEGCPCQTDEDLGGMDPRGWFTDLWDSLNAKRGFGWDANPWVAAVTFEVERENVDAVLKRRGVAA
nr:hypothetical protein [Acuticoccus sediminis]